MKFFITLSISFGIISLISTVSSAPQNFDVNQAQRQLENDFLQFLTTVRKQWKCVGDICEETLIKCSNNNCDTTKNRFSADEYRINTPVIKNPSPDIFQNFQFPQFPQLPQIDIASRFDNTGLIDIITNPKDASQYWANSKQINKNCHDNICEIKTRTYPEIEGSPEIDDSTELLTPSYPTGKNIGGTTFNIQSYSKVVHCINGKCETTTCINGSCTTN
ncbi:CLUMA_CG011018, isoform B [Clunio marinus]|uniref:CLUMA_CG011018, isoform B n=1 Tax=Clunio marinus TaxID=568069 RepID=A0A1J1IGS0_9DIPT|nr:CLUMA_CG011018, isoform B [Clunio marinus]